METKPDWEYWNQLAKERLWKLVLLSLELDPERVNYSTLEYSLGKSSCNSFRKRLDVAFSHASYKKGAPLYVLSGLGEDRQFALVETNVFLAWAKSMEWQIPSQFVGPKSLAHAPVEKLKPANIENSLTIKERGNLYNIIGALLEVTLGRGTFNKHPDFNSQSELVGKLTDQFGGFNGMSKANLESVFAKANEAMKRA
jgi:hypothetical protein